MLPIIHTHVPHTQTPKYPSVTVQPMLNVCVPDEKCQSQQPGPNLTRGQLWKEQDSDTTSCRAKEEEGASLEGGGTAFAVRGGFVNVLY